VMLFSQGALLSRAACIFGTLSRYLTGVATASDSADTGRYESGADGHSLAYTRNVRGALGVQWGAPRDGKSQPIIHSEP